MHSGDTVAAFTVDNGTGNGMKMDPHPSYGRFTSRTVTLYHLRVFYLICWDTEAGFTLSSSFMWDAD